MFSKLFHKDVYMPDGIEEKLALAQSAFSEYTLSRHFKQHLVNRENRSHDYLGKVVIECLEKLKKTRFEAFEIEYSKDFYTFGKSGWFVTKYCVRIPYDQNTDLVVVVQPKWDKSKGQYDSKDNLIRTAWLNNKRDAHCTLDSSKYCDKESWEECQW